jgi:hypothetical protein
VTLDLTTPHVPPARKAQPVGGRNRKVRWVNTGLGIPKKTDKLRPLRDSSAHGGTLNQAAEEAADSENEDEDDEDGSEADETNGVSQGADPDERGDEEVNGVKQNGAEGEQGSPNNVDPAGNKAPKKPPRVQILDLHSKNPVVSYDGHIYSCQWVSNIGTELLFTRHDPDNPLPALRTLPGDVDLLAASSARIISTSVELHPTEQSAIHPLASRARGEDPDLAIPVGQRASIHRKDQAQFLENLMNIKEEKGEEDPVTVFAHSRKTIYKWNEHVKKKQQAEKAKLQRIIKRGGRGVKGARERLAEIEKDEARRKEKVVTRNKPGPEAGKRRYGGIKVAPKRKESRPAKRALTALTVTPEVHTPTDFGMPGYEIQSNAASSQRFESEEIEYSQLGDEEMEEEEEEEEEGEGDEEIEEEEEENKFYDAEELYDEDAPGEDDDTHMYEGYG